MVNPNTVAFVRFCHEFGELLDKHGLGTHPRGGGAAPYVDEERAAVIMLSEIHEWFRSGDIDASLYEDHQMPDDPTWTEFCRAIAEVNLDVDKHDPTYPDDGGGDGA